MRLPPPCPIEELDYNIPLHITLKDDLDEDMDLMSEDVHHIIRDISYSLPLTNVQSLYVIEPHSLSSNFWKDMQ